MTPAVRCPRSPASPTSDDLDTLSIATGDLTGDGVLDVLVGAPFADPAGGIDDGVVYLLAGPISPGVASLNVAGITIAGANNEDAAGNRSRHPI